MSLDSSCICSMRSIFSLGGAQQLRSVQHLQDVEQPLSTRDAGGESPSTPRGSGLSGWHSQLGEPHPHPLRFVAIATRSDRALSCQGVKQEKQDRSKERPRKQCKQKDGAGSMDRRNEG